MGLLERIYSEDEYRKLIRNTIIYTLKRSIPHHDLEDCVADVYLVAAKKRDELEKHPNLHAWLILTAKNIAKQYIERAKRERNSDGEEWLFEIGDNSAWESSHYKELIEVIEQSLRRSEFKLFKMRFIEELSADEISVRLGVKSNAVEARIVRLRKKLKNIL